MNIVNKIKDNPYLFFILLIAFISRFAGIFHDLPYSYYPDEEHFVNRAVSFGAGDMNPHWFHKPAFLMYLLFFEYGLYFVIGKIFGLFTSVEDFAVSFFQSEGPFLFIGRLTVALFGVATVLVTYLIGRDCFNKRTGLFAALFLSLIAGHVMSSQVVKADVPTAFFTILSFYFVLKIYDSGRLKYYILAGIFAGLGTATKYYSVALLPTFFLAHFFYLRKAHFPIVKNLVDKSSLAVVATFLITFFIASPYNFIDPLGFEQTFVNPLINMLNIGGKSSEEFLRSIGVEVEALIFIKSLRYYFSVLMSPESMGEIGIIATIGLIMILVRVSPRNLIIFSFPVLFILIANKMNPFYSVPRHLNPIYPFMAIFAAYGIDTLFQRTMKVKWLVLALSVLILVMPAYRIVQHDYLMLQRDTRTLAKEWIEANIQPGTKILIDENSVKLSPDKAYYEKMLNRAGKHEKSQFTVHAEAFYQYSLKALPEITYDITIIRFPWWRPKEEKSNVYFATSDYDKDMGNPHKPVGVMPYQYYKENGYDYVVVYSGNYAGYFKEGSKKAVNFPSFYRFYSTVFNEGELVREFHPDRLNARGYIIKMYKVI